MTTWTRRNVAALTGVGLVSSPLLALAAPAFAADCGTSTPAASEVSAGICEVQFTTDSTFTAPSGVTKLTALIVGAGGGHVDNFGSYAGGGGDVVFVSSVDTSGPITIVVGAGTDGSSPQAGSSVVNSDVAEGGYSGTFDSSGGTEKGGMSGGGNAGSFAYWTGVNFTGAGGGAGGDGSDLAAGAGVTASEAAAGDELWPAVSGEPAYGAGGSPDLAPGALSDTPGEGASNTGPAAGNDGIVILRWATPAPALAETGLSMANIMLGAVFAAGMFLIAYASFSTKGSLKFAGSRNRLMSILRRTDETLRRDEEHGA